MKKLFIALLASASIFTAQAKWVIATEGWSYSQQFDYMGVEGAYTLSTPHSSVSIQCEGHLTTVAIEFSKDSEKTFKIKKTTTLNENAYVVYWDEDPRIVRVVSKLRGTLLMITPGTYGHSLNFIEAGPFMERR